MLASICGFGLDAGTRGKFLSRDATFFGPLFSSPSRGPCAKSVKRLVVRLAASHPSVSRLQRMNRSGLSLNVTTKSQQHTCCKRRLREFGVRCWRLCISHRSSVTTSRHMEAHPSPPCCHDLLQVIIARHLDGCLALLACLSWTFSCSVGDLSIRQCHHLQLSQVKPLMAMTLHSSVQFGSVHSPTTAVHQLPLSTIYALLLSALQP